MRKLICLLASVLIALPVSAKNGKFCPGLKIQAASSDFRGEEGTVQLPDKNDITGVDYKANDGIKRGMHNYFGLALDDKYLEIGLEKSTADFEPGLWHFYSATAGFEGKYIDNNGKERTYIKQVMNNKGTMMVGTYIYANFKVNNDSELAIDVRDGDKVHMELEITDKDYVTFSAYLVSNPSKIYKARIFYPGVTPEQGKNIYEFRRISDFIVNEPAHLKNLSWSDMKIIKENGTVIEFKPDKIFISNNLQIWPHDKNSSYVTITPADSNGVDCSVSINIK